MKPTDEKIADAQELRRLLFMLIGLDPAAEAHDPEHLRLDVDAKIFTSNGMMVLNYQTVTRLLTVLRRMPVAAAIESRLDRRP